MVDNLILPLESEDAIVLYSYIPDVVDIYPWMGQAGKQSKASKALHETNALSRDHA